MKISAFLGTLSAITIAQRVSSKTGSKISDTFSGTSNLNINNGKQFQNSLFTRAVAFNDYVNTWGLMLDQRLSNQLHRHSNVYDDDYNYHDYYEPEHAKHYSVYLPPVVITRPVAVPVEVRPVFEYGNHNAQNAAIVQNQV